MCSGKAVSLVQALIDCHAVEMTKRYLDGINTGDALWAVEAIERVGPGGNFMMDPTTIDLMRSGEMWYSELTNMEEDRGKPMVVRAREEVDRILSEFTSPVSDGVRKELRQHVEKG